MQFEDFVEIFAQIARALQYVHNNNIIHRDLKPSNVMIHLIGDERYVKLLDFGLAKVFTDDGQPAQKLTATGASFGSPPYMSPEQCQGMKIDARADIYSFGCLMYECIAGDPPIIGENALHTIFKQVSDLPKMLPFTNESEHQLALLVDKCLHKNPEGRYQNVGELLAALSKLQRDSISPTSTKEQTGSQPSLQAGGFGAKWTKRTEDSTSVTPVPRQPGPQPVRSPVDYDTASLRPARPRMTRPDTPLPPAGSWEAPPPVAPPAGQQPPADDWVSVATKKMFKAWKFMFALCLLVAVVVNLGVGLWRAIMFQPQLDRILKENDLSRVRTINQFKQLNQLNSPH
jgi:serine/threonine protein kinase